MGKKVLIAEPRDVIRAGLRSVFQKDISVSEVSDVATREELKKYLSPDIDLAVVSQTVITDMKLLPQGRFVLLIDKPDFNVLMCAYEQQARGYFSVDVAAYLLLAALNSTRGTFLIDPVLFPWMMGLIAETKKHTDELELLSPREREVVMLLNEGLDRHSIARQLYISEATLKTHIKNISHKYEDARCAQKVLVYKRLK
ncbi:MAG: response regulator transcription factor [Ktedonobacteraceae bacterium]|nr:response regulator transcription factor [Ktedonobacteraceae bacterium]